MPITDLLPLEIWPWPESSDNRARCGADRYPIRSEWVTGGTQRQQRSRRDNLAGRSGAPHLRRTEGRCTKGARVAVIQEEWRRQLAFQQLTLVPVSGGMR